MLSGCQNKEPRSSTEISDPLSKDTLKPSLPISKNDNLTTAAKVIRKRTVENITCYEEEIIVPKKWLKPIPVHKKDNLPDSLAIFLTPFLQEYSDDMKIPSIDFMDIIDGNLDEDIENEKVLFIKYFSGIAEVCYTLVLDYVYEEWLLTTSIIYISRYSQELPEINSNYKILVCKSGTYEAGHNGNYCHFYKKIRNCWKNILNLSRSEFFGGFAGYTLESKYQFVSNDQINITFYYSYFYMSGNTKTDGSFETIDIIKNKKTDIVAIWNEKNQVFEAANPKQAKLMKGYATDFHDSTEISYLKKYGSPEQKKGIEEIEKRFPKKR
jgi:hypothetical protein